MSDELKIPIAITADTGGAEHASAALGDLKHTVHDVSTATEKNTKASKETGDVLAEMGRRGSQSRDVMEGLGQAMKGDVVGGMQGAARAMYAFRAALATTTGVIGIIIGVITIMASKIREVFAEAKANQLKKQAEETSVAFDAATLSVDRLNKVRAEAFQERLQSIDDVAKSIVDHLDRMDASAQKLDDINKAMELANVDANPNTSAEEKLNAKDEINARYRKQAEDRAQKGEDARLKASQDAAYKLMQETGGSGRARDAAAQRYEAASGQSLLPMIAELRKQLEEAKAAHPGADVSSPALDQLEARLSFTQSDAGKGRAQLAKSQLDQAEASDKAARDKLRAAEKAAADLEIKIAEDRKNRGAAASAQSTADSRTYYQNMGDARAQDNQRGGAQVDPAVQGDAAAAAGRAGRGARALLDAEARGAPSLGNEAREKLREIIKVSDAAQKDGVSNNELERIIALIDSLQKVMLNPSKGLTDIATRLNQLEIRQRILESQSKSNAHTSG